MYPLHRFSNISVFTDPMFYLLEELIVPKHAAFSSLIELCFTLLTNTGFYKSSIDFDRVSCSRQNAAARAPCLPAQSGPGRYKRDARCIHNARDASLFDLTGFK